MSFKDCDICNGSGIIRLPVRQPLLTNDSPGKIMSIPIREYSCPECGDVISNEKVMICQAEELIDSEELKQPGFMKYCQRNLSLKLGDFLYKNNLIEFSKEKSKSEMSWREIYSIRAKLGVISPRTVATFEERVNQRQMMIADIVVNEAIKRIRNWNSYYDKRVGGINKDTAIREILETFNKIREESEIKK